MHVNESSRTRFKSVPTNSTGDVSGKVSERPAKTTFITNLSALKDFIKSFFSKTTQVGPSDNTQESIRNSSLQRTNSDSSLEHPNEINSAFVGISTSPQVATPSPVDFNKKSTLSQLDVALENFKKAGVKCGLTEDNVNKRADELKESISKKVDAAYVEGADVGKANKLFRDKHDDFGLTKELTVMLDKQTYGMGNSTLSAVKTSMSEFLVKGQIPGLSMIPGLKLLNKITGPILSNTLGRVITLNHNIKPNDIKASKAMKATKADAIDEIGTVKADKGFQATLLGENYTTTITKQTDKFVSSASNKTNGNTCGNLNLQTLATKDGVEVFKTLRQAAITAKPVPDKTNVPALFGAYDNAAAFAQDLKRLPTEQRNAQLVKLGIDSKKFEKMDGKTAAKKVAKQCALLNKAIDVGKAAWKAQGSPAVGTVNITSLSLMTPDFPRGVGEYIKTFGRTVGAERAKLADQTTAFELLSKLAPEDLKSAGIGAGNTKIEVNTFNFGVNEGESLGASFQKTMNDTAMQKLLDRTTALIESESAKLDTPLDRAAKKKLEVKIATMTALRADIETSYKTFSDQSTYNLRSEKGWWRADQAYTLTQKISFLTQLNGDINTCNCASGKDRTGMHVQNALNFASLMTERMTEAENKTGDTPKIDTRDTLQMIKNPVERESTLEQLQKRNLEFMTKTGQHEIQQWNTGSPGYKLYEDTLPNLFTGGQTSGYFETLSGLSKDSVAEQITGQAKHNAT